MKNLGILLLVYNLTTLILCFTDWYSEVVTTNIFLIGKCTTERYNIIDYYDVPFYCIAVIYFFYSWHLKFKNLTQFQKECFVVAFILVGFKVVNEKMLDLSFGWLIGLCAFIISMPLLLIIERKRRNL